MAELSTNSESHLKDTLHDSLMMSVDGSTVLEAEDQGEFVNISFSEDDLGTAGDHEQSSNSENAMPIYEPSSSVPEVHSETDVEIPTALPNSSALNGLEKSLTDSGTHVVGNNVIYSLQVIDEKTSGSNEPSKPAVEKLIDSFNGTVLDMNFASSGNSQETNDIESGHDKISMNDSIEKGIPGPKQIYEKSDVSTANTAEVSKTNTEVSSGNSEANIFEVESHSRKSLDDLHVENNTRGNQIESSSAAEGSNTELEDVADAPTIKDTTGSAISHYPVPGSELDKIKSDTDAPSFLPSGVDDAVLLEKQEPISGTIHSSSHDFPVDDTYTSKTEEHVESSSANLLISTTDRDSELSVNDPSSLIDGTADLIADRDPEGGLYTKEIDTANSLFTKKETSEITISEIVDASLSSENSRVEMNEPIPVIRSEQSLHHELESEVDLKVINEEMSAKEGPSDLPSIAKMEDPPSAATKDAVSNNVSQVSNETKSGDNDGEEPEWLDILGNSLLRKKVVKPGHGETSRPVPGQFVTISFSGALDDGTVVDSSPGLQFILGDEDVIQAFDLAVALMELEEEAILYTDARYAYSIYGRPELEPPIPQNAHLTYNIKVIAAEDGPRQKDSVEDEEKVRLGDQKRVRGNDLYARGDYGGAINAYKRGMKYLEGSSSKEVLDMRIKTLNNLSAAQLKVKSYSMALESLEAVLNQEPENVKALFRQSKCLEALNKDDKALTSLKKASMLDPQNKLILQELAKVRARIAETTKKEKEMYQKMFQPAKEKESVSGSGESTNWSLIITAGVAVVGGIALAFLWHRQR